ncbi:T-complex protein 11-like protein 1 isoform X2 [Hetaerina americana]|uniref:T-complex protein 11-like protein 1 isoform X2 n=1 Tax=Hetaerina americana TaxID=62018 RepID=UPI003A7F4778
MVRNVNSDKRAPHGMDRRKEVTAEAEGAVGGKEEEAAVAEEAASRELLGGESGRPEASLPVDVSGAKEGARQRYESEGSSSGSDEDKGKRQRTGGSGSPPRPQRGFVLPSVMAASPPKFVSLEEIMQAANGVTNMALAHEIAVNRDFKLEKLEPPENSLQKQIKDTVHRAFWDVLAVQLAENPPNYTQAMVLLEDIKNMMLSVLLPHHTKIRDEVSEVLDIDLVRQQAEAEVLDFQHYAQYIISFMAKLCAPVRDERIRELTQTSEIIPLFKGILETLDLMKLDMANFAIEQIRPHIMAQSVDYEKKKFAEFLKSQEDGLEYTKRWLGRHLRALEEKGEKGPNIRAVINQVLTKAYLELVEWNEEELYPETVLMDQSRFSDLNVRVQRATVVGTVLLVTAGAVGSPFQGMPSFKNHLKDHIMLLIDDGDLEKILPNIADQVKKEVSDALKQNGIKQLSSEVESLMTGQILEVSNPDHRIRQLVKSRVLEFLGQVISSQTAAPVQIPPGLSSLQEEISSIAGTFLRLVSHNRSVFGEYYATIITDLSEKS